MKNKGYILLTTAIIVLSLLSGCNEQSVLSPINAEFDFDVLNDVTFEINNAATSISHLEGNNIADGDYEITSSLLTIDKNYLISLSPGQYEYDVFFNDFSEKISLTILDKYNQYRLVNGGFETGDYFGWTSHTVFKGEKNLSAFANEAISVNGSIATSETPYNGDGDYVYGMPETISKSVWEEKMGHLVSSSFILGGSGHLSFKMGAGKNADLNYIRVIDEASGIEVARFASQLFDSELPSLENASLHLYQANLSSHIGKKMHLEVIDMGGHEWDFLTLDSFETFLEQPLSEATLLEDIKPLSGAGYVPNQLVNGDFSDGLNHWTPSSASGWQKADGTNLTWRNHEGVLKSELSGDSARGLIRSSFFRVDGSGIVSLDIGAAQGSRFDKDTFISIKERGTNQELIRFANTRHNGIFLVKYYVDLSQHLDKVCYFEIVDNAIGSYDTIFIDNIVTYYETRPDFDFAQQAVDLNY
ncbi:MAG: hypothetical protein PHT30_00450 [Bacilli bacterium]|nr:hypothetical protein [Bacilli bacterium]